MPLCDYKPCFQELQDICVDYVEVLRKIKLYAGGGTDLLRQQSSSSLAFLVDGGVPESDSANSVTDSCDGSESEVEHGTEEIEEAKRIIEMEKAMEQEGVKCFVVIASRTDLAKFPGARVQAIREETLEQWMMAPVELVRP